MKNETGKRKLLPLLAAVLMLVIGVSGWLWFGRLSPGAQLKARYSKAMALLESAEYEEAIAAFEALDGYRDSAGHLETARLASAYAAAEELAEKGETARAAMAFYALGGFWDARQRSFALWRTVAQQDTISAGYFHTVGLKSDGTVVTAGWNTNGQCDVSGWSDILAVSAGYFHTAALKADGTVVAAGWNESCQCDTGAWNSIRIP
ncbi:MAG: hypothetical protein SPI15_10195 [Candidatus Faecousia sp.]|nr:hypothetical protein [Clostridiales bacterium]MDY6181206.1 hypothetical protein [Candidatus Faecousia sp.]